MRVKVKHRKKKRGNNQGKKGQVDLGGKRRDKRCVVEKGKGVPCRRKKGGGPPWTWKELKDFAFQEGGREKKKKGGGKKEVWSIYR